MRPSRLCSCSSGRRRPHGGSRAYLCMAQPGLRRMVAAPGLFVPVPELSFLDAVSVPVFAVVLRL